MKAYVYIDGFNLYYGAAKDTPYKWLNVAELCRLLLPNDIILKIKYYTAIVDARPGDPGETIMAIAGHVSPRMLAHYSHIRMEAKRQALDALSSRPSQGATEGSQGGSYDTKNDTIQRLRELPDVQVVEKSGRREWIRTIDLYRVKVAL